MSIQHNGQTFTIKRTTEPVGGEKKNRTILGMTDEAENIIVFDGTLPQTRQFEVILHEVMHVSDMTAPESTIKALAGAFFGLAQNNGLDIGVWLDRLVDGEATAEEVALINEVSTDIKEMMPGGVFREVDEGPWSTDPIVKTENVASVHPWELSVHKDGKVNRAACYLAQARLMGSGASINNPANHKAMCRELVALFDEWLEEDPEPLLRQLSR